MNYDLILYHLGTFVATAAGTALGAWLIPPIRSRVWTRWWLGLLIAFLAGAGGSAVVTPHLVRTDFPPGAAGSAVVTPNLGPTDSSPGAAGSAVVTPNLVPTESIPPGAEVTLVPETTITLSPAPPEWGCPREDAVGAMAPPGVFQITGLEPNAEYALCIDEYDSGPPADSLRRIDRTSDGQGFWNLAELRADNVGDIAGKLEATIPLEAEGFYYDVPYHVKLFVKDTQDPDWCIVLFSDNFVFRFQEPEVD